MKKLLELIDGMKKTLTLLERELENSKENKCIEYLDSTGAVITQPQVHLADKKHTVSFPAIFKNGKFFNDKSQGDFEFDYEFVKANYWIVQTGDRIACHRNDCLFNKYKGCTIKPMLTIGTHWKVACDSYIDLKNTWE
jgi:hypothetical protein